MLFPGCSPYGQGLCISSLYAPGHRAQRLLGGSSVLQNMTAPNMTLLAMVTDKALHSLASISCQDSSPLTLYFYTSNSEPMLLRADSPQNIPCSFIYHFLCPHLRAGDPHSAFAQLGKGTSSCQRSAGWISRPTHPLAWSHISLTNLNTISEAWNKHS